MEGWKRLLLENKAWAQDRASRPREAGESREAKDPDFMWIGCSCDRVPAQQITGAGPGELFVHSNVANLVIHTDPSLAASLELGIRVKKIEHIIVCGRHNCCGIRAAMDRKPAGMASAWFAHLRDIWYDHKDELGMHDEEAAERRLVELNVLRQVKNLAKTEMVQRAWAEGLPLSLHGWVFDHADDLIQPLVKVDAETPLDDIFRYRDL